VQLRAQRREKILNPVEQQIDRLFAGTTAFQSVRAHILCALLGWRQKGGFLPSGTSNTQAALSPDAASSA